MDPQKIVFPQDELGHRAVIEWWYWNGHLTDESGAAYAFMYCLFKVDPKRVNLPFIERVPVPELYFSHYLVSDIGAKKSESGTHFFTGGMEAAVAPQLLRLESHDQFSVDEHEPFSYTLKTPHLDADFVNQKPPLLVNGAGWVPVKSSGTYYYSLTDLRVKGVLQIGGKKVQVTGVAWMDHQWSDEPSSTEDKWNWFSLQLDNHTELLCCEYGDKTKVRFATIAYADGRQATTRDVRFTQSGDHWVSPKTQAAYPVSWTIELPEWNMRLTTAPKIREQEVIFGSINYWEGAITVSGTHDGANVSGQGFMELVGVPMGKSVSSLYLQEAEQYIANYVKRYL